MRHGSISMALMVCAALLGLWSFPKTLLAADSNPSSKSIRLAIVRFDARPSEIERNLDAMERLTLEAVDNRAHLVMFHELAATDYMDDMTKFAEAILDGPSCQRMKALAEKSGCYLSFGMPEKEDERLYIAQVFFGPQGFVYSYRKTWLCQTWDDGGYRDEWARYNPGTGPELFQIDGIRATCFICSDATAPRCNQQARVVEPDLVFFPVNRGAKNFQKYPNLIAQIGALTLVANRVGKSYERDCALEHRSLRCPVA